jgi:hypothetical protein
MLTPSSRIHRRGQRVKQRLTNSRLAAYRLCPRLHHVTYTLGWRPAVQAAPLTFGTAFHAGMETYWTQGRSGAVVHLDDPFEQARVEAMLAGYFARWEGDFGRYETISVEEQFEADLEHPVTGEVSDFWVLAGKLDLVLRDLKDDAIVLGEHKTTSADVRPGSTYWQQLRLNTQISQYYVGARALGYDFARTLYDVAAKPKIDPYRATPPEKRKYTKAGVLYANQREVDETPAEFRERVAAKIAEDPTAYYSRGPAPRTQDDIVRAMLDTWDYAERLKRDMESGWAPRNPDSCFKFGRACHLYEVCCGDKRLDCGDFVQSENVHPELADAKAA